METVTKRDLLVKLTNYEEWKHCITVMCGIPLTSEYIDKRIMELNDLNDFRTTQFVQTWGEPHREQTLKWFEQAKTECSK